MIIFKTKLGQGQIEISGDIKEVASLSTIFGKLSGAVCSACKSSNIYLGYNSDKDANDYYHIDCGQCNAKLKISQFKKGGFFIKNDAKFEVYQASNNQSNDAPS